MHTQANASTNADIKYIAINSSVQITPHTRIFPHQCEENEEKTWWSWKQNNDKMLTFSRTNVIHIIASSCWWWLILKPAFFTAWRENRHNFFCNYMRVTMVFFPGSDLMQGNLTFFIKCYPFLNHSCSLSSLASTSHHSYDPTGPTSQTSKEGKA